MKKSEKGFTLVELLAVIAILAILVIIALPNVINMYTKARVGAFESEAKSLYKAAQQKFMADQLEDPGAKVYATSGGDDTLDLQGGNADLKYCFVLDANGNVTIMRVSNGSYKFEKTGGVDQTDIEGTASTATVPAASSGTCPAAS